MSIASAVLPFGNFRSVRLRGKVGVIEHFCDWLVATPLSTAFQTWSWFVPGVQIVHILCISILFMVILRISARLLFLQRHAANFRPFIAAQMPVIWTALSLLLVSGILLTITEPARELLNWAFRTKMILVVLWVCLIAAVRQATLHQEALGNSLKTRIWTRAAAILLVTLGVAIATAGRWIAYV